MEPAGADTEKRNHPPTSPGFLMPMALSLGAGIAFWVLAFMMLGNPPGVFRTSQAVPPGLLRISLGPVPGASNPGSVHTARSGGHSTGPVAESASPGLAKQQDPAIPDTPGTTPPLPEMEAGQGLPENQAGTTTAGQAPVSSSPEGSGDSGPDPPGGLSGLPAEASLVSPETLSRQALDESIRGNLVYPALARKRGITGTSTWRITLGPTGELEALKLLSGSGSGMLDDAAERSLRRAFPLGASAGVRVSLDYRITFVLQ